MDAENWASNRPATAPQLTDQINEFFAISRREAVAIKHKNWRNAALVTAIVVGGGIAWATQDQWEGPIDVRWYAAKNINITSTRSGVEFRDCSQCPQLVIVPPGKFLMGLSQGVGGPHEKPQHTVMIPTALAITKFEVQFSEWDACVDAGGCDHVPDDGGWERGDQPVINVSYDDALKYAKWLSSFTGKKYRLLSESKWEYAARAGSKSVFYFNEHEKKMDNSAWYRGNSKVRDNPIGYRPYPVGRKKPNAFGLHDMFGNVSELVMDCWHENFELKPKKLKSSGGVWNDKNCENVVVRGGSFADFPEYMRSSYRFE